MAIRLISKMQEQRHTGLYNADHNITNLLQREQPDILSGIRVGRGVWRRTEALISRLRSENQWEVPYALLICAKSMTLDDLELEGSLCTLFQNTNQGDVTYLLSK